MCIRDSTNTDVSLGSLGIGVSVTGITTTAGDLKLKVIGQSEFNYIGIGTTASPASFPFPGSLKSGFHLFNSSIGINSCSTYFDSSDISASTNASVGIGSTVPRAVVDFSNAANDVLADRQQLRFMLPPTVTTTAKVGLTTVAGAIVYDLTLNKLQCFNGTTWNNLF